jgi:hypothetical protein
MLRALLVTSVVAVACTSKPATPRAGDDTSNGASAGNDETGGANGGGSAGTAANPASGSAGDSASGGRGATSGTGGKVAGKGGSSSSGGAPSAGRATAGSSATAGAASDDAPDGFWDANDVPAAQNVMMFKFLNRTNGQYSDSELFWSFKSGTISETHSFAEQPLYDMPANSSGRLYFYICATDDATCASDPTKSKYFDFIEHTIGATQYNGNTTRVDAFGLKLAMRLHCADGYDIAVGENYATFAEDRAATFQAFIDAVPDEFKPLAEPPYAPYRIVEPGADSFKTGGANEHYYDSFVDELWSANGLTIDKPGANGSGLASNPDVSAAIFRHVGASAGTFDPTGKLLDKTLWSSDASFYTQAPADYYAAFFHARALRGKAYGFPYDDVGSYSSYISHSNPEYLLVAVGW